MKTLPRIVSILDVLGMFALTCAAGSITAYFWFTDDLVSGMFLHAFFPWFLGCIGLIGLARVIELSLFAVTQRDCCAEAEPMFGWTRASDRAGKGQPGLHADA